MTNTLDTNNLERKRRAGRSDHPVGTKVRICNIVDPIDADLNGRIGYLAMPFKKFPDQDVGVLLETDKPGVLEPIVCFNHEYELI